MLVTYCNLFFCTLSGFRINLSFCCPLVEKEIFLGKNEVLKVNNAMDFISFIEQQFVSELYSISAFAVVY